MASAKKKPDPAARVTFPLPASHQAAAMAAACVQQVTTIQANPDIANHPEVAAASNVVLTQANALAKDVSDLSKNRSDGATIEAKRDHDALQLRLVHANMEALVNIASGGNKAAALAWGGKLVARTIVPVTSDAPLNASATATATMGTVLVKCKAERGAICYLVQEGTDPVNTGAWPPPSVAGGARHLVSGLTVGQKAYFRIAIVRRGGVQGAWSEVLAVTVR